MTDTLTISQDAKVIMISTFMNPKNTLTFQMVDREPTPRMQNALDELIAVGYITKTQKDGSPAVSFNATEAGYNSKFDVDRFMIPEYKAVADLLLWGDPSVSFQISQPIVRKADEE